MYLQYFVGLSSFTTQEAFDASLMVSIRYRLGQQVMEDFNQIVLHQAGVIPSPSKDISDCASSEYENKGSHTSADDDQKSAKDKEEDRDRKH